MSRRRGTAHAFRVISGFLIVPASLAGVLLAGPASAAPAAANPCAAKLTAVSASTPSPVATPSAASSAPASPTPSVSSASPTPAPSSASPTTSPSPASPTPTPSSSSPTPSPSSSSPSPSPSPSTSSGDTLCLTVQALAASVRPSGQARYAVWVWLAGTVNGTAKVSIAATPGKLAPSFTVCPTTGGTTCSVALTAGQAVQLRAAVAVPQNAAGTHLTLTATGTSPQSAASATASGSVLVPAAGPTSSAGTPSAGLTPTGAGAQLPGTTLPEGVLPSARLPLLPSPVTDPSLAFPQVTPSPDPTPASTPVKVNAVSASFPLSTRLVGGQIIGLAVLAAAITIAVARLSIRKPRPQHTRDPD
jgi:hypothetical protein